MNPSKWDRTHSHIQQTALELFRTQGYDTVTTAHIANEAGVSAMTLFRHFPTKETLVLDDGFDPAIAEAVRAQPRGLPPMRAVGQAFMEVLSMFTPGQHSHLQERLHIISESEQLRRASLTSQRETAEQVAAALGERGVDKRVAHAVATAVIAGLADALLSGADLGQTLKVLGGSNA